MNIGIIKQLLNEGYLEKQQSKILTDIYSDKFYSLYYEHKAILLIGVFSLTTGMGMWLYENIGSLSHNLILLTISILTLLCFGYVTKNRRPFKKERVISEGQIYDYTLFLGCLLFLTLEGYVEYRYGLFTDRWDVSALIPTILFFFLAYQHDHRGVLSMAIVGLTAWVGIKLSPKEIFGEFFKNTDLIAIGSVYSILLMLFGFVLNKIKFKSHFTFNYLILGCHIFCLSVLHGLFRFDNDMLFFIMLMAACLGFFYYAKLNQSFVFTLFASIYGYIGVSYLVLKDVESAKLVFLYFTLTGGFMVYFLFNYKKFFSLVR